MERRLYVLNVNIEPHYVDFSDMRLSQHRYASNMRDVGNVIIEELEKYKAVDPSIMDKVNEDNPEFLPSLGFFHEHKKHGNSVKICGTNFVKSYDVMDDKIGNQPIHQVLERILKENSDISLLIEYFSKDVYRKEISRLSRKYDVLMIN